MSPHSKYLPYIYVCVPDVYICILYILYINMCILVEDADMDLALFGTNT